jgi:hypothetical protein
MQKTPRVQSREREEQENRSTERTTGRAGQGGCHGYQKRVPTTDSQFPFQDWSTNQPRGRAVSTIPVQIRANVPGTSVATSWNDGLVHFQEVQMLFFVALGMAAVGFGWVAVRRKRKASEQTTASH